MESAFVVSGNIVRSVANPPLMLLKAYQQVSSL